MNLHGIVSAYIGAINPNETLTIQQSTGSTQNADYTRTPTFTSVSLIAQVQALSSGDLRLVEALNIQGVHRKVYVNGQFSGVVRATQQGGDLVTRGDGSVWKITQVAEPFDTAGWCSFIMTLQDGA